MGDARLLSTRLLLLAAALSPAGAWAGQFDLGGGGEEGSRTQTVLIEPDEKAADEFPANVRTRAFKALRKNVPDDRKIRVRIKTVTPNGMDKKRYIARMTPLNDDGEPHGKQIRYTRWNSARKRVIPYKDGERHGVEKLFAPGGEKLLARIPWKEGERHGVKKTFHPNGELATRTRYEQGEPVGVSKSYNRDGELLRKVHYKDGKRHGARKEFWPGTDQLKRIILYRHGEVHGTAKAFYKDGSVKWKRPFVEGEMHGVVKHYDPGGTIGRKAYYLHGKKVSQAEYEKKTGGGS